MAMDATCLSIGFHMVGTHVPDPLDETSPVHTEVGDSCSVPRAESPAIDSLLYLADNMDPLLPSDLVGADLFASAPASFSAGIPNNASCSSIRQRKGSSNEIIYGNCEIARQNTEMPCSSTSIGSVDGTSYSCIRVEESRFGSTASKKNGTGSFEMNAIAIPEEGSSFVSDPAALGTSFHHLDLELMLARGNPKVERSTLNKSSFIQSGTSGSSYSEAASKFDRLYVKCGPTYPLMSKRLTSPTATVSSSSDFVSSVTGQEQQLLHRNVSATACPCSPVTPPPQDAPYPMSYRGYDSFIPKRTIRKPKTYAKPVASRFCHICSRMPRRGQGSAICRNMSQGLCRKIVCERCIVEQGWDYKSISESSGGWLCPHCAGLCPSRSQCHIYNRINARRKRSTDECGFESSMQPPCASVVDAYDATKDLLNPYGFLLEPSLTQPQQR